jgi:hypothetical protein
MNEKEFAEICAANCISVARALENKEVVEAIHQNDKWAVIDALQSYYNDKGGA